MRLILALCLGLFAACPAVTQDVESRIQGVINDQIDALTTGDLDRAFSHASDMLHGIFRTPENFGMMVENGYDMVINPRGVTFQTVEPHDGALWQKVLITDEKGALHTLIYEMIETPEGLRINSVQLVPTTFLNT